ncbi:unnamed protein product [Closterium sp. NIES-65]|nr:unnamed protein product [Closterium sp. NIES-65]
MRVNFRLKTRFKYSNLTDAYAVDFSGKALWPHREEQWQADGRGAASAFSSCLKPLAAADNTCGPPFALLLFMHAFPSMIVTPSHSLPLPPLPSPSLHSPPLPSHSPPSNTPSQELKSSAAGRLRRHAMPAAHAASTASCSHLVAVPPPVAPPSSLALCAHSPIHLAPTTVLSLALWTRMGRRGGGLPLREAAEGAAAALISPSHVSGGGGALGSTPTLPYASPRWPCRDSWGREGGIAAADGNRCHKGEYRGGLGLSRSLASHQGKQQQQQQQQRPGWPLPSTSLRLKWRGGALGSKPTLPHAPPVWLCRDPWGWEDSSTAADGNRCHKGENRGGLGLSRWGVVGGICVAAALGAQVTDLAFKA